MTDPQLRITILLKEPYPFGMACTNRIHLYAKGLLDLGNDVEIVVPRPTEPADNIINTKVSGVHDGVRFRYAHETQVRSKYRLKRIAQDAQSFLNAFLILKKNKPHIILVTGEFFRYIALAKLSSVILKAKLVRERSEVPYFRKPKLSCFQKLKLKFEYMLFDGLIIISKPLQEFFTKELSLRTKSLLTPILVDKMAIKNFCNMETKHPAKFVYSGSLIHEKDGVLTIIKALSIVKKKFPSSRLILTGDIDNSPDKHKIFFLINELALMDNVTLTGYISKKKLKEITRNASALLSAKPKNRQNRYNMATKIGEYLSTGRPIVVSSVESACHYLTHRKTAFIVNPDEVSIANELDYIMTQPIKAEQVGRMGQQLAFQKFDYKKHSNKIQNFFQKLL
jgi:glycosyltransferase involved in cell wall biosynthesis